MIKTTETTMIAVRVAMHSRWAVGGLGRIGEGAALPVIVDPRSGTPWLPGATVAGSLKAHLRDHPTVPGAADDGVTWLGADPVGYEEVTGTISPEPSRLAVLGCLVDDEAGIAQAGSTSIDDRRGAAPTGPLRTYEWASPCDVTIALQHEGPADAALLEKIATWQPTFGRGRGAGLGRASVKRVTAITVDRATEQGLTFWLGDRASWFAAPRELEGAGFDEKEGVTADEPNWSVDLMAREPIHVGSGGSTLEGGRTVKSFVRLGDGGSPVIPGTSWKGVFRHRARVILEALETSANDVDQVLDWLFGSLASGRGALWFDETVLDDDSFVRSHVAIDRFTGGARPGAAFWVRAVRAGTKLSLGLRWVDGELPPIVETLLLHILRDLHEGLQTIGGMGSRGYGWVELEDPALVEGLEGVDRDDLVQLAARRIEEAS